MRNPILACVIKQYGSDLYRTCVSFTKGQIVFLSAHPDEESASETIDRFEEACRDGTITTADDLKGFAVPPDPNRDPNPSLFSTDGGLGVAAF